MKKKLNDFINGESLRMRDIAVGPAIGAASAVPVILIVLVVLIAAFALVKIIGISRRKNADLSAGGLGSAVSEEPEPEEKEEIKK